MIEIGVPSLEMEPVSFIPDREIIRGDHDELPADLAQRVRIGGPLAVPITSQTVAGDSDLRTFVAAEATACTYYLVHLAATFTSAADDPPFVSATLELLLSADGHDGARSPIAWSMLPQRVTDDHTSATTWNLGPKLALHGFGMSLGSVENTQTATSSAVFIEALGLLRSDPSWRIAATARMAMTGTHRFVLVVRGPREQAVHAVLGMRSTVRSRSLLRYRSQALPPVVLSAAL